ncbi:unnamed protein product [Parnassius apollo]|uniref:(apollo) hypothetical protein n=1 Tax=Parnassius apollo TaxID=110799 RepID=A0A8S3YBY2_PARAO|nr:unnamed protein product [Parnassius apollo]
MACSYLSASGMKAEPSSADCWTPPNYTCLPELDSLPSQMGPPFPKTQINANLNLACQEPALDLTTNSASLKPRLPSPKIEGDTE